MTSSLKNLNQAVKKI